MFGILTKEKLDPRWLWGSLVTFIVMLIVNGLAGSTKLIGGVNTAEVSDTFVNLFAPAGFTFSIWGIIYLLLALFMLRAFGVLGSKKPQLKTEVKNQLLILFTVSSVLNVGWLLAWQYQVLWLSVLIMIGLLVSLKRIVALLNGQKLSYSEYLLVRVPFSVYLGWISVATIANITAWLVSVRWDGLGWPDAKWTVLVLIVGAIIAILAGSMLRDPFYLAVFVWAYVGILYKHLSESGFNGQYGEVIVTIVILLPVLIVTVLQLLKDHEHAPSMSKFVKWA